MTGFQLTYAKSDPTERYPTLSPVVGALILIATISTFIGVAVQVANSGALTMLDGQVANWLHARATPALTSAVMLFTHLHGVTAVSIWAILVSVYFAYQKKTYWLTTTVIGVAGVLILNVAIKIFFQRARPSFPEPLLTLSTYSFPSGHTAGSTVLYGVIATYLCTQANGRRVQLFIICLSIMLVALVGLSRIYLGVHFLSDIVAAIAEGCAWLAATILVVSTLRRRIFTNPL